MTQHNNKEADTLLKLAERDNCAFEILIRSTEVAPSISYFHAQQIVEKCIKAVLIKQGVIFKRTHDLVELYHLLNDHKILVIFDLAALSKLNPYAVLFRYDDTEIELISRTEVVEIVSNILNWCRSIIRGSLDHQ